MPSQILGPSLGASNTSCRLAALQESSGPDMGCRDIQPHESRVTGSIASSGVDSHCWTSILYHVRPPSKPPLIHGYSISSVPLENSGSFSVAEKRLHTYQTLEVTLRI